MEALAIVYIALCIIVYSDTPTKSPEPQAHVEQHQQINK